jgi:hypothetical protein
VFNHRGTEITEKTRKRENEEERIKKRETNGR